MSVTTPRILAAARALADYSARTCNVNAEDNWNLYSEEFIAMAREAMDAVDKLATAHVTVPREPTDEQLALHSANLDLLDPETARADYVAMVTKGAL